MTGSKRPRRDVLIVRRGASLPGRARGAIRRPGRIACQAAAALGLTLDELERADDRPGLTELSLALSDGAIGAILGPSGAGKSTLLADIGIGARRAGWSVIHPPDWFADRPCVALFGSEAAKATRALSFAGLADARVFLRNPGRLSAGERARLAIALALHEADRSDHRRPRLLLLDEFGASLDGDAARSLASLLRRAPARIRRLRIVLATHRHALLPRLGPKWTVSLDNEGRATVRAHDGEAADALAEVEIALGSPDDVRGLAHHHYRPGRPRAIVRVLVARERGAAEPIGVLAVAMPALNGAWRRMAWPDLFSGSLSGREHAKRLNEHIRTIARVIIDPRWRGLGLARRLVEAYLADPLTDHTEALASMGRICPFFEAAGMAVRPLAPSRRDARLLDALDHAGLREGSLWRLARPAPLWHRFGAERRDRFIHRELALWADGARATRRLKHEPTEAFECACRALASRAVAYTHQRAPP